MKHVNLLLLLSLAVVLCIFASVSAVVLEHDDDALTQYLLDYDNNDNDNDDYYAAEDSHHSSLGLISKIKNKVKKVKTVIENLKDFKQLLEDSKVTITDSLKKMMLSPSTYPCFFNAEDIQEAESDYQSTTQDYHQDAAAAFYAANEYNNITVDKNLPDYRLIKAYQINSAKASFHVNDVEKVGIFSIQGTVDDWDVDFEFSLVDCLYGPGKVHKGFQDEVRSLVEFNRGEILKNIKSYLDRQYTIIFTGHSQGGPEAVILAQAAAKSFPDSISKMRIVTLASPRVGSNKFAEGVKVDAVRYAAKQDIITKVPFPLICYRHVGEKVRVKCPHDKLNSINCHYPEYYFDDINSHQDKPYDVKGAEIADIFNYKHSNWNMIKHEILFPDH